MARRAELDGKPIVKQITMQSPNSQSPNLQFFDARFEVGQQWRYQTRTQEPESTFTVVKVESYPQLGFVIHISVADVRIASANVSDAAPDATPDAMTNIGHLPFSQDALSASATNLAASNVAISDDYREGYEQWKAAFEAGRAGVWSISLSQAIEAMEGALRSDGE